MSERTTVESAQSELDASYQLTLDWLLESCAKNGNKGSSAWESRFLHPIEKWSFPYPETSGYLIPTLYDARKIVPRRAKEIEEAIDGLSSWLLALQLDNGAFPGGHSKTKHEYFLTTKDYLKRRGRPAAASVFNTGQIVHGLVRRYRETGFTDVRTSIERAAAYLAGSVADDGSWRGDAYAKEASPSYFTYVSWPLLEASTLLADAALEAKAIASLDCVLARADASSGFIAKMAFPGNEIAHTHTVGYVLEGLLESGRVLGARGKRFDDAAMRALEKIMRVAELRKKMPGGFGPAWKPDWSYECVTGDCQLGLCFLRAHELTGDPRWLNAACRMYSAAAGAQTAEGAIPGSQPIWGKYMSFRFPNWAGKFFLDLILGIERALEAERRR